MTTKAEQGRLDAIKRLLRFIDRRGEDECWPWIGGMGSWGYGSFWLEGRNWNASRAAYKLLVRDPGAFTVCHRCDNPPCCNPHHLFLGTQGDNVRDCNQKGRGNGQFESGTHPRHNAKLNATKVAQAKALYASGVKQTEIARRLGVNSSTISRAVRGERWGHV